MKITHFHEPLKPIQLKGRQVPLHLLDSVKTELSRSKDEGRIKKLENCGGDRFISPIVIICKKDKSIKLALDSKFINKQFTRLSTKCRIFKLQVIPFEKCVYAMDKFTSKQCNFSIVGGDITGTYQFLTGFCGLGDMPNKFQRLMNLTQVSKLFTNCYLDDILIASKGTFFRPQENRVKNVIDIGRIQLRS